MPRRAPGRSAQAASTREAELAALLRSGPLRGSSGLIADATGMGRPVVDLLRLGGLRRVPVVIHGGGQLTRDPVMAYLHVPERELVSGAQVLLQAGRFKFAAALPEVKTLVNELLSFEVKISEAGNDVSGV